MDIKFYTIEEIMRILRISRNKYYSLVKNGDLKPIKQGHKSVLIPESSLSEYLTKLTANAIGVDIDILRKVALAQAREEDKRKLDEAFKTMKMFRETMNGEVLNDKQKD